MRVKLLVSLPAAALVWVAIASSPAGQSPELGVIQFPTSGAKEAQEAFLRGVKSLHSFQFDDAAEAFQEAQRIDPGFAMAYWGEAMSYNHPLWAEVDVDKARKALERLAPTREARAAKAKTPIEKGFFEAVEILFGEGEKLARDAAYSEAMERLSAAFPSDHEVSTFYALSILGTVRPGDEGYRRQMQAAAISQEVFRENPNHPGAAHYVIHSLDDPVHAPLSLRAADAYAKIAPAAGHALHMPSHIYVQRGMWEKTAASNRAAYAASVAWAERKGLPPSRRDFHSLSWLHYAYLQQGNFTKAAETVEVMRPVAEQEKTPRVREGLAMMNARHVVETQQWRAIPIIVDAPPGETPASGAHMDHRYESNTAVLLAAGLSAARLGDFATAEQAEGQLRGLKEKAESSGNKYRAKNIAVMEKEVGGALRLARGRAEEALALLKEAASIEQSLDPPSGPPEPIKPSHELYGEALLEAGKPKEAAAQFAEALERMPNRALSLLGAARAAARLGDRTTARRRYSELTKIWAGSEAPALQEARRFLNESEP